MKSAIFKFSAFILLFAFIGAGCEKDEDLSYLDNTTPLQLGLPGFSIYKTKKDYFYNVSILPYMTGFRCPELDENDSRITFYKGKYFYSQRFKLSDNYIASFEIESTSCFTNLSYDEYIREKLAPKYNQGLSNPKVINSIEERNPFIEIYYSPKSFNGKAEITIQEINQLIKEKNLEKYFTKIK